MSFIAVFLNKVIIGCGLTGLTTPPNLLNIFSQLRDQAPFRDLSNGGQDITEHIIATPIPTSTRTVHNMDFCGPILAGCSSSRVTVTAPQMSATSNRIPSWHGSMTGSSCLPSSSACSCLLSFRGCVGEIGGAGSITLAFFG